MIFLMFALTVAANTLGTIFIKIGSSKISAINLSLGSIWSIMSNLYVLAGIFFYAASFPAYSYILQRLNVSVAYPIFASAAFAAVILISSLFLKESLTILQIFGLILIIGGIILLAVGARA